MNVEVFRRLGLFVVPDFLSAEETSALGAAMVDAPRSMATVHVGRSDYQVLLKSRSTRMVDVPAGLEDRMQSRLDTLITPVGDHFGFELAGAQRVQFLLYEIGDFYEAHADSSRDPGTPEYSVSRRVTVVVFVNGEGDEERGDYRNGHLTLTGTIGEGGREICLPVTATPGLLVAFPSDTVHEVTPVTAGLRLSMVTWFV